MWEIKSQFQVSKHTLHFQITANEALLCYAEVIDLWQNSASFRHFFNIILVDALFPAFFWEVAPINNQQLEKPFEFVLVNNNILPKIVADPQAFQAYFNTDEMVVDFWNLGKDAHLIVPTPIAEASCYPHLAQFVRHAPVEQIDAFWQRVGEVYAASLNEQPLWLSTAGLGVSWLHLRVDSRPKYYRYGAYKKL